jgi:hypothetical protein
VRTVRTVRTDFPQSLLRASHGDFPDKPCALCALCALGKPAFFLRWPSCRRSAPSPVPGWPPLRGNVQRRNTLSFVLVRRWNKTGTTGSGFVAHRFRLAGGGVVRDVRRAPDSPSRDGLPSPTTACPEERPKKVLEGELRGVLGRAISEGFFVGGRFCAAATPG